MTNKTFLLLAPLAALLGGCPIYLDDGHGRGNGDYYCDDFGCYECDSAGCWDDGDLWCSLNEDCPNGTFCDGGMCVNTPNCDYDNACPGGYACDFAREACVPQEIGFTCETSDDCFGGCYCDEGVCLETGMCEADEECAAVGENLICDGARATCIPDPGPCPTGDCGCAVDADCGDGLVCEQGLCFAPELLCQTDTQCGEGRVCDGAFCAKSCSVDGVCPTGQACGADAVCRDIVGGLGECVYSSDCGDGNECINATCFSTCSDDSACGGFEYCDHGACRPDDRPL